MIIILLFFVLMQVLALCPKGYQETDNPELCEQCQLGTYNDEGIGKCKNCETCEFCNTKTGECLLCDSGKEKLNHFCVDCKKGYYSKSGWRYCIKCENCLTCDPTRLAQIDVYTSIFTFTFHVFTSIIFYYNFIVNLL